MTMTLIESNVGKRKQEKLIYIRSISSFQITPNVVSYKDITSKAILSKLSTKVEIVGYCKMKIVMFLALSLGFMCSLYSKCIHQERESLVIPSKVTGAYSEMSEQQKQQRDEKERELYEQSLFAATLMDEEEENLEDEMKNEDAWNVTELDKLDE